MEMDVNIDHEMDRDLEDMEPGLETGTGAGNDHNPDQYVLLTCCCLAGMAWYLLPLVHKHMHAYSNTCGAAWERACSARHRTHRRTTTSHTRPASHLGRC